MLRRELVGGIVALVVAGAMGVGVRGGVRPAEDLSTPQKAMVTFVWAYRIQDGKTMASATLWEDLKDLRRLFLISPSDSTNSVTLQRELAALYAEAFPKDADAKKWISDGERGIEERDVSIAEDMKKLAADISVKVEGDIATCTTGHDGGDMLLKFRKVDGKWKLLPEFFGTEVNKTSEKYQVDLLTYELTDKAYAQFRADVKAGKFGSWKEANDALPQRMLQVTAEVEKAMSERAAREKTKEGAGEK